MNAFRLETDIIEKLPAETLAVLRERAVREGKPLIDIVKAVLIESASRFETPAPKAA